MEKFSKFLTREKLSENRAWQTINVTFGEDRMTRELPEGNMIFAKRNQVVKYRKGRRYQGMQTLHLQ
jgi:hypothetical protein